MKKLLSVLLGMLCIITVFSSCTKNYLKADRIVYKAWGHGNYLTIYSNKYHQNITINLDGEYTYSEVIRPGDSLSVMMMSSYSGHSGIKILMGTAELFDGTPDITGVLMLDKKFHKEDFRLK